MRLVGMLTYLFCFGCFEILISYTSDSLGSCDAITLSGSRLLLIIRAFVVP